MDAMSQLSLSDKEKFWLLNGKLLGKCTKVVIMPHKKYFWGLIILTDSVFCSQRAALIKMQQDHMC